jgi:hypothetical protein
MRVWLGSPIVRLGLALALVLTAAPVEARAEDKLLAEAVDFTGTFIFLGAKVPGLASERSATAKPWCAVSARLPTAAARRPTATR